MRRNVAKNTIISGSLEPFDFLDQIGEGGMGKIWRARHRRQKVEVAVKFIQADRLESERARSMFRREAHAMALLNHRSILSIYDFGELLESLQLPNGQTMRAGSPYLVMDYASGGNLRERPAPSTWNELRSVLQQVLNGLAHAHARSLFHRDLKPENIVAKERQNRTYLQLTDFGLAYISNVDSDTVERELSAAGTPAYMAPEQIKADWRRVGPWTDLYSVGVIGYELATGRLPFHGANPVEIMMGHLNEPVPVVSARFPVPEGFMSWAHRLLSKLPEGRFQTAVHALDELERLDGPLISTTSVQTEDPVDFQESETLLKPTTTQRLKTIESTTTMQFEPFTSDSRDVAPLPEFPVFEMPESWSRAEATPPVVLTGVGLGLFGVRDLGLVGREEERDAIWANLRRVREQGTPHLTLVRAPSGRGASSIASWTVRRSGELGVFEVVDLGMGTRYALEFLLGTRDLEGEERIRALHKSFEQVGRPDLVRPAASVIAGTRGASPDRVLASYIDARSRTRPMAVLIDDAHDELASLTLIRNLLGRKGPIAIVAVIRDDDLAENLVANEIVYHLDVHPNSSTVEIGPMKDDEMRAMLQRLLPLDPLDLERVVEAAQGNPRFATEALRDWVERGELVPRNSWYVADTRLEIPDHLHRPWKKRVQQFLEFYDGDELEAVRFTLEIGAYLGALIYRKDWDLAVDLAGVEIDKFFLNEAGEARLLEGDMKLGRFTHPMLRFSLMRTSEEDGRSRAANRICAQVVEVHYDRDDMPARLRLARHLLQSGEPGRALQLAISILEYSKANDLELSLRAMNLGQEACDALELPITDPRSFRLATLVIGAVYHISLERAEARAEQLLEHIEDVGPSLAAGARLAAGTVFAGRSRVADATHNLDAAIDLFEQTGDAAGEAEARCRRGYLYRWTNDNEAALRELERALELADPENSPRVYAIALTGLGVLKTVMNGSGERHFEEALEVLPAHETRQRASTKSDLAEAYRKRGRFEEAAELYREAIDYFEGGRGTLWLVNQTNLALTLAELGRWDEMMPIAEMTVVHARRQAVPIIIVLCSLLLALGLSHSAEPAEYEQAIEMALEALEGSEFHDPDVLRLLDKIIESTAARGWDSVPVERTAAEHRARFQTKKG